MDDVSGRRRACNWCFGGIDREIEQVRGKVENEVLGPERSSCNRRVKNNNLNWISGTFSPALFR